MVSTYFLRASCNKALLPFADESTFEDLYTDVEVLHEQGEIILEIKCFLKRNQFNITNFPRWLPREFACLNFSILLTDDLN